MVNPEVKQLIFVCADELPAGAYVRTSRVPDEHDAIYRIVVASLDVFWRVGAKQTAIEGDNRAYDPAAVVSRQYVALGYPVGVPISHLGLFEHRYVHYHFLCRVADDSYCGHLTLQAGIPCIE